MSKNYRAEAEAYAALGRCMEAGREAAEHFHEAGIPPPPPLARLLGIPLAGQDDVELPSLASPHKPLGAHPDWLWLPIRELSAATMILGTIRAADGSMAAPEIVAQVTKRRPDFSPGTVHNALSRLQTQKDIKIGAVGVSLVDRATAPVLDDEYGWAPLERLSHWEVAYFRREVVLHILRHNPAGIAAFELRDALNNWKSPPVGTATKENVKADLEALSKENHVRVDKASKRWTAISAE
jgi:Fe2+ or Zn2+ uptake regulation protein